MTVLFRTLLAFPRPLVTAINGHAIAGGCIIAAASDYRLMAEGTARIGVPELLVGVPFPMLPLEIVRARISATHFRQLVLSGRTVPPAEAAVLGFIDDVAPAGLLLERAMQVAAQLRQIPSVAFALTKRAFTEPLLARVEAARSLNDEAVAAWESAVVQERMRAYVERTVGKR